MVLPKNIEITPTLEEIRKGVRPKEITITTYMDGPFGQMENTTVWRTQFDHKVEMFREDIVFKEGWFDAGVTRVPLMPWNVSYSHKLHIGKVGQAMFGVRRYGKYRLYGSRDIYYTGEKDRGVNIRTRLAFVKFTEGGKRKGVLLGEDRDVDLWKLVMRIIEKRDVSDVEVESVSPKVARGLLSEKTGASKTIDKARENSLRLKFQLYKLMVDMEKGKAARDLFDDVDQETMKQVVAWSAASWESVSTEDVPSVW